VWRELGEQRRERLDVAGSRTLPHLLESLTISIRSFIGHSELDFATLDPFLVGDVADSVSTPRR